MTKVLAPGALDSSSLQIGGGAKVAPMARRKTPSELRGEQLRRSSLKDQANESFDVLLRGCKRTIETDNGIKKQEQLKNPKYIEMRMDELYPVKKARSWMLSGKENPKENNVKEKPSCLKNVTLISNVAANKRQHLVREQENAAAAEASDDAKVQAHQSIETCSQSRFRSVTELSTVGVKSSNLAAIDMNKALKALATCEPLLGRIGESSGKSDNPTPSGTFVSEFHVAGQNIPLDLSLKTCMRLVSTSPVNWSIMCSTYNGMPQLKSRSGNAENYDTSSSGSTVVSQVLNSMALHSWVHPQSTLPPFIISALVASGQDMAEIDFLRDRQSAWEDSFRSLYFMFRKNLCNIFYVCTSQFVVMFTARGGNGGTKRLCSGYITQSTRRLRALLKELDICFSMPLCQSKMEQVTTEDLVELSEIEKHNLGQTRRRSSFSDIDNTPESLLAFIGNQSVHGLYDLLLNYRSSLGFLPTADVPVLYSPVPFQNAALSSPEIKCTEMVRMEHSGALPLKTPPGDHCCMVEVKGSYLPPWIISNMCAIVGSDGRDFEASFVTEQTSVGLNVALPEVSEKTDTEPRAEEGTLQINEAFGVHGATFCHQLRSGQLKSLKYCKQSYKVSLSPL
ncbi:PREDICTED: protein downstream neighbor of Son isoform X2 [Tarenaya hassleriana]|uniref:protein downstream neighbor of Son isoform X2 n=1 Tax=Tarenaya hassleriana TaxID=28532 RepID=UPI00053C7CDC|nr:PREDICTED: protein downstream neighbor of Son isoform X2 [Tarenaya hassleriana]